MASGMEQLGAVFDNIAFGNIGAGIVQGLIWTILLVVVMAFLGALYVLLLYRIKPSVFVVAGSGTDKYPYTVSKKTWDLVKVNKDGSWTWFFRRFKKEEKFPDKYVYPGNTVVAFKVGNKYFPGKLNLSGLEQYTVSPVPYDVRRKVELEMQQIDLELQKPGWWNEGGKTFVLVVVGVLAVTVFAGFVVWLAFKKTDQVVPAMERLTDSLRSFGTIPGK